MMSVAAIYHKYDPPLSATYHQRAKCHGAQLNFGRVSPHLAALCVIAPIEIQTRDVGGQESFDDLGGSDKYIRKIFIDLIDLNVT